jgi:hypothetical protein
MVSVDVLDMLVWGLKSLGVERSQAHEMLDLVWEKMHASSVCQSVTILLSRAAAQRAALEEGRGNTSWRAALDLLETMRAEQRAGVSSTECSICREPIPTDRTSGRCVVCEIDLSALEAALTRRHD